MKLVAAEGWPFIAVSVALTAIVSQVASSPGVTLLFVALTIFVISFFRDPERVPPGNATNLVSPADGKIVFVGERSYPGAAEPTLMVSVFMSVFNVHVNRNPMSGTVTRVDYQPGAFLNAARDDAPVRNERNLVVLATPYGEVAFCQVAGLIARRIICYLRNGDAVRRGERMGLIRFGSRLDIFVPRDWQLNVRLGQYVRAGSSIVAVAPAGEEQEERRNGS